MVDARIARLAKLVVDYCIAVKPGEEVSVEGSIESLPLLREVVREVVTRGGYPFVRITDESLVEVFYRYAPESVLRYVSPVERELVQRVHATIRVHAPTHTKPLSGIDPTRIKARSDATRELTEIFLRRSASGELKWVVVAYPTRALAQEAGMSIEEYENFVYRATYADTDDPVSVWTEIGRRQQRIVDFLSSVRELRFTGPGVDLVMRVDGRRWINDDGRNNMPGGEVFSAPIEDSVEGYVEFDYPAIWRGIEVDGVKLVFRRGVVVEAKALRNEEFLRRMLEVDEGARRVGEIAFGLNYSIDRATRSILFDEKIGGTIHLALGSAYPETGGRNISAIHWDLIKDMRKAKVYADGDLVYENGRFISEVLH
ncbi:MAG: aminopeptidase [Candidatus Nezhaarchaeales archaeon]